MTKFSFIKFQVKRFRSLIDVTLDIPQDRPVVICGENNIGKTNFLRALNIFFNHIDADIFDAKQDIPHHIYQGSRGGRASTEMIGWFSDGTAKIAIKFVFRKSGDYDVYLDKQELLGEHTHQIEKIRSAFRFLFVESHNVNLPDLISTLLENDGLLPLDKKRSKQSKSLEAFDNFIELSQSAIKDIEKDINDCFEKLTNFDGVLSGKKIKIRFAEYELLREAVRNITSITLYDGNNHGIASKGSGAQRAVFLALMQYISQKSHKNIIWGIDEPEAFLQPKLQRKVAEVLSQTVARQHQPIILTTHSQYFINLRDLDNTHLFEGKHEEKTYERRPGQIFYEMTTAPQITSSAHEKALSIKSHLGIIGNDGWQVMPHNLLVEGEEDKKYFEMLLSSLDLSVPNTIWSGGASKIAGYLQFYNDFASELGFKPRFLCLFDNDDEGREQAKKIKPSKLHFINVDIEFVPRSDGATYVLGQSQLDADWEVEDFLPADLVIDAVNIILRKLGYRAISVKQRKSRSQPAFIRTQILKFAEECAKANNSEKDPIILDEEGRKKQICQKAYQLFGEDPSKYPLETAQIDFLKKLVG